MFSAGLTGVKIPGKPNSGDKTLIDALEPATITLETAAASGSSLKNALSEAHAATAQGMKNKKNMIANRKRAHYQKRAHYLGKRGLGHQDAGITAVQMLFKTFADYVK